MKYLKISPWYMSMKLCSTFVILFLVAVGCKDDNAATVDEELSGEIEEVKLPDGFMTFIDKFSTDSIFQMNSIQWPLQKQIAKQHPEDDEETITINPEEWKLHRTFDDMNGTYSQQYINFNDVITEMTVDKSGQYTMIRRFSKIDGDWKLIFYKEMGL